MLTAIALLIAFAAYATGAVAVRRKWMPHSNVAGPIELVSVVAALILMGVVLPHPSFLSLFFSALALMVVGGAAAAVSLINNHRGSGGTREFEDVRASAGPTTTWKRWLQWTRAVIDYEIRLVIFVCYVVIIGPIAITFRLLHPAHATNGPDSTWLPRSDTPSLETARRPF